MGHLRNWGRDCELRTGPGEPAALPFSVKLDCSTSPPTRYKHLLSLPSGAGRVCPPSPDASLGSQKPSGPGPQMPLLVYSPFTEGAPGRTRGPRRLCVCVEGGRTCEQGWRGVPNTRLSRKSAKRTTVDTAPTAGPHPLSPSTGDGKD